MDDRLELTEKLTGAEGGDEELCFNANQHLCIGAQQDIRTLLHRTAILFDEYGDLRFQHFRDIFQDMKFSLIFAGRQSFKEMFELTEDLLDLAKQETFSQNNTALRGAALYLMYSLYFKQPFRPKARIKVSLQEYKDITSFVNECRLNKHWEVPYVFYKLVLDDAFHYVAVSRPVGLESIPGIEPRRKAGLPCGDDTASVQERHNPFKSDRFKKITKRLDLLHANYASMKIALRDSPDVPDRGLSLISDSLPRELMSQYEPSLLRHPRDEGMATEDEVGNQLRDTKGLSIGDRRKKLKYADFDAGGPTSQRDVMRQRMVADHHLEHSSTATSDDEDPDYYPIKQASMVEKSKKKKGKLNDQYLPPMSQGKKKGKGGRPKGSSGRGLSKSDVSSLKELKLGAVTKDKTLLLPKREDK